METGEVKKYYRWSQGSRTGLVEVYLAEDTNSIWFESGRFVQKELFDSQLIQISEDEYRSGNKSSVSAPPPMPSPQTLEEWEAMLGTPQPTSISPPSPKVEVEKSAISIILEKQKKFEEVELMVKIPVKLPVSKAIEFMNLMFDEDEVADEITEFVRQQLPNEEIVEIIKNSIREIIQSRCEQENG